MNIKRLIAVLIHIPTALAAQPSDSIAAHRGAVESGLLPQIIAPGERGYDITERMAMYRVPGLSIAVINEGAVEWAAGYGVTRPWTTDSVKTSTLFQAASISKALTALAVLRLVEDGRLALDRDVGAYLHSWTLPKGAQTTDRPVTLRRLLSHTAGTNVHGFGGVPRGDRLPTTVEILEGRAGTPPVRVVSLPGERFSYSGGGYEIVQLILEDVTGEPFARLMQQTVLAPLGMRHSTFEQPLPAAVEPTAATGHQRSADKLMDTVPGGWHNHSTRAAAGLWTTPSDLARFALGIRAAWLGDSDAIIDRELGEVMLTAADGPWGLAVPVSRSGDSLSFGHGGNDPGYAAFFVLYAVTGDGVVVMANAASAGDLIMEVVRGVAGVYDWPGGDYAPRVSLGFEAVVLRVLLWLGALVLVAVAAARRYLHRPPLGKAR